MSAARRGVLRLLASLPFAGGLATRARAEGEDLRAFALSRSLPEVRSAFAAYDSAPKMGVLIDGGWTTIGAADGPRLRPLPSDSRPAPAGWDALENVR